jgi:hypothetical protein
LAVTLLFTFAEFYIVIDQEGVVSSMIKAANWWFDNGTTLFSSC